MGTIWVKEMTGGLDTRRLPETTPGGVLVKAQDGHITRGGEFEKRAAFEPDYDLPAGTTGLARDSTGLVVFGVDAEPAGLPSGVSYQRLQNPDDNTQAIDRILSHDLYDGKLYVSVLYENGSIFHFYDETVVDDWFDGRARTQFTVTGGVDDAAVAATASFNVSGGSSSGSGTFTVAVNSVTITNSTVSHTDDDVTTAGDIADSINAATSTPDYSATSDGSVVIVTAPAGAAANGRVVSVTTGGDATVDSVNNFSGGVDEQTSTLTDLTVDGVSIITSDVEWAGSAESTASAIETEINGTTSSPNYTATAVGAAVNIIAADAGPGPNGYSVAFSTASGLTVSPTSPTMADGASSDGTFTPGEFVKTVRSKMYSVSDGLLHFSGIRAPAQWTTDVTGAGFINLTTEDAEAENLTAVERYQNNLAVFAEDVTMIWYIDPDPTLNVLTQILASTGTAFPNSVTQFGDADVFYLDTSGLRSLRARDSSNSASTTDIGVPVDSLITAKAAEIAGDEHLAIGLINPLDKRFWLIMKDEIFVFSFYENAKVSAWSTYITATTVDGTTTNFNVDAAVLHRRKPHLRSGDKIYVYGGTAAGLTYDETQAEGWLPFLDANMPSAEKYWTGVDAALTGQWEISAATAPIDSDAADIIARIYKTTYNMDRVPMSHSGSHMSLRFKSQGDGPAIFSAAVIHYEGGDDED